MTEGRDQSEFFCHVHGEMLRELACTHGPAYCTYASYKVWGSLFLFFCIPQSFLKSGNMQITLTGSVIPQWPRSFLLSLILASCWVLLPFQIFTSCKFIWQPCLDLDGTSSFTSTEDLIDSSWTLSYFSCKSCQDQEDYLY